MRYLTPTEIEELASRKGVRRIAVENFLGSMGTDLSEHENLRNLQQDNACYRWNMATQSAIAAGIKLAAEREK